MPAGLKQTSSPVAIGFSVTETGANTFTQGSTDLNLSPLDREVFVVLAVNLDPSNPDALTGIDTQVRSGFTTTSQTAMPSLADSNCLARSTHAIRAGATNDFFVQVQGVGNLAAKGVSGKLYGYRATATADIYAALVQSEVLSS
jgi:hypothetical protein